MLDIMDYYGRQRALCGGSLGPLENLGWAFAHPDPPPQMAPLIESCPWALQGARGL